jgi:hypothetical protein
LDMFRYGVAMHVCLFAYQRVHTVGKQMGTGMGVGMEALGGLYLGELLYRPASRTGL